MRRISLAVLMLMLHAVDPTLALAMGAGGGGSAGGGGTGAGGNSAGAGGAGSGTPINPKGHGLTRAANDYSTADAAKDPLLIKSRHSRSVLLERAGRQ